MASDAPDKLLSVFLCHSSGDKAQARETHSVLKNDGYAPWLDEIDILPGQDWDLEIRRAIKRADCILVFLSKSSISKAGYIQKEIRHALDAAKEQPPGSIFLIPLKLEPCEVPEHLGRTQWLAWYQDGAYQRLKLALDTRSRNLGLTARMSADTGSNPRQMDSFRDIVGEYLVTGVNPDKSLYEGGASISRNANTYEIRSDIGADQFFMYGTLRGNTLRVSGDFSVVYTLQQDGSLQGVWAGTGTETLIPTEQTG